MNQEVSRPSSVLVNVEQLALGEGKSSALWRLAIPVVKIFPP